MQVLTDDSPMPWGKFQGTKMINVPDAYLLWVYNNMKRNQQNKTVFDYIEDNLTIIEKQCSQTTKDEF